MNSSNRALQLYRRILRAHRSLPEDLKQLGSDMVRAEFKANKGANPSQVFTFLKMTACDS